NDQPVIEGWHITTGENEKTIRTGRVKIVLPGDKENEFEVVGADQLVVRWKKTVFTLKRRDPAKPSTDVADIPDIGKPLQIEEPPPLGEWIKGRTMLTVAQD